MYSKYKSKSSSSSSFPVTSITFTRRLFLFFYLVFVLLHLSSVMSTDGYTKEATFLCVIVPSILVEIGIDAGKTVTQNKD